jgi:hypothetical protein
LQAYENSTGIASSDKSLNGKFSGNLDFNPLARNHDQNQDQPHDQSRDQPRDQSREEQQ